MRHGIEAVFMMAILAHSSAVQAAPTFYPDRATFLAAVGSSITDGYTAYGTSPGTSVQLTDAAMSAVLGETTYTDLSDTFNNNSVGDVFLRGDKTNYCAGCNGNCKLGFGSTSFSTNGGVFGVGIDIVLHTSRYVSIGDDDPSNPTFPGGVLIEFTDGSTQLISIPADIGYYEASTYFLGISDERGVASITIGTEVSRPHFWVIDNLTVADSPDGPLTRLLEKVTGIGPGKSLANKVALAQVYYDAGDIQATCAVLTDFVNEVRAQRGKKIKPTALADELITDAQAIMTTIGCT